MCLFLFPPGIVLTETGAGLAVRGPGKREARDADAIPPRRRRRRQNLKHRKPKKKTTRPRSSPSRPPRRTTRPSSSSLCCAPSFSEFRQLASSSRCTWRSRCVFFSFFLFSVFQCRRVSSSFALAKRGVVSSSPLHARSPDLRLPVPTHSRPRDDSLTHRRVPIKNQKPKKTKTVCRPRHRGRPVEGRRGAPGRRRPLLAALRRRPRRRDRLLGPVLHHRGHRGRVRPQEVPRRQGRRGEFFSSLCFFFSVSGAEAEREGEREGEPRSTIELQKIETFRASRSCSLALFLAISHRSRPRKLFLDRSPRGA